MTSRRRTHADARTALAVRQVQEQAALMRVQVQRQAEDQARARLSELETVRADREGAWNTLLAGPAFDPIADGLWRASVRIADTDVRQGASKLEAEAEISRARRADWEAQLRRTEAARSLERSAGRQAARGDEARRLAEAEDVARSREINR